MAEPLKAIVDGKEVEVHDWGFSESVPPMPSAPGPKVRMYGPPPEGFLGWLDEDGSGPQSTVKVADFVFESGKPSAWCNWPSCGCDFDELCDVEMQRRRTIMPEPPLHDRLPAGWWLVPAVLGGTLIWVAFLWWIFRPT